MKISTKSFLRPSVLFFVPDIFQGKIDIFQYNKTGRISDIYLIAKIFLDTNQIFAAIT